MFPDWLQDLVAHALNVVGDPPRDIRSEAEDEANRSYVFCWNKDEWESSLMWAAYGDHGRGVCLQTTKRKILTPPRTAGPKAPSVHAYYVNYIDHNDQSSVCEIYKNLGPSYSLTQFKSREFKGENELRIVATLPHASIGGDPIKLEVGLYLYLNEGGGKKTKVSYSA